MFGWYWHKYRPPVPTKRWAPTLPPATDRQAVVTWAELEVPTAPRRAIVTWGELEVPTAPRRTIVTWAELEVPNAPNNRRALVTWAELELPDAPQQGGGGRPRRIFGPGPWSRRAIVTWAEVELPDPQPPEPVPTERPASGLLGDQQVLVVPATEPPQGVVVGSFAPWTHQRRAIVTWAVLEVGDPPQPIDLEAYVETLSREELKEMVVTLLVSRLV